MLSFKKLKFHDEMTEETDAYTAEVYWTGTFIGNAQNTGKGGMTNLTNWNEKKRGKAYETALAEATAFAKSQKGSNSQLGNYEFLEDYIDDEAWQTRKLKTLETVLRRRFKKDILATAKNDPKRMLSFKPLPPYTTAQAAKKIKECNDEADQVLNLLPIGEAVKLYVAWIDANKGVTA